MWTSTEHQNWFGMDEQLGPVAISIKREKLTAGDAANSCTNHQYQYRLVIRTSELLTLRGAILEDAIPNLKSTSSNKSMSTKEVLEYVAPEVQLNCLRLGAQSPQTEEQLLKLDEQGLTSHYKVGIMYCKAGQASEEEMYNNEDAGPAFLEFLDCIGQRVRLKGFDKYKAGLDNKSKLPITLLFQTSIKNYQSYLCAFYSCHIYNYFYTRTGTYMTRKDKNNISCMVKMISSMTVSFLISPDLYLRMLRSSSGFFAITKSKIEILIY